MGTGKKANSTRRASGTTCRNLFRFDIGCMAAVFMACDMAQGSPSVWMGWKMPRKSWVYGLVGIMSMRVPLCPAIGDGISLSLFGFRNQSPLVCFVCRLARVVQRARAVCPHGKSPWADDGMKPKQTTHRNKKKGVSSWLRRAPPTTTQPPRRAPPPPPTTPPP